MVSGSQVVTAVAALVAEAIAKAEAKTPKLLGDHSRVRMVDENGDLVDHGYFDRINDARAPRDLDEGDCAYIRRDAFDAALAHLATRAAEAEGRAERAERQLERAARLGWIAVTRIHALNRYEEGRAAYDEAAEARLTRDAEWLAEACANGEAADDDWEKYERVAEEALAEDAEKEAGRG